ncbi:MAG: helicase [Chloroflexi bacterium]|nr:helicase [Chloroflexota bacterium]
MSYSEFLACKARRFGAAGRDVATDDVHSLLYDWQREGVRWAVSKGRCALFWDCGLGKTFAQVEWARLSADRALIVAPLSVARQTVREAEKLGVEVRYVREQPEGDGLWITNYEMVDRFDPATFGAVVLDESSILKNVDGRTRKTLTERLAVVDRRLACTATPAPNDVAELANHAEYLGVMSRPEMLAAYFINDERNWRLKGHAASAMYQWMASWALAARRPSDLGYPDDGYELPELSIVPEIVKVEVEQDGQLFATDLGGVGGRAQVRRGTLAARCERACELASDSDQWIVWCGLNDEAAVVADQLGNDAVNVEGSWLPDAKAEALEAFQDGEIRVLVTKPAIAGFGMNFQNAARMAFVGLSDSYEAYYQAIRRCWRFGQARPVRAYVIVSELEQQIARNVARKEAEAAVVTEALVSHMATGEPAPA